jgi:hypothetical protein
LILLSRTWTRRTDGAASTGRHAARCPSGRATTRTAATPHHPLLLERANQQGPQQAIATAEAINEILIIAKLNFRSNDRAHHSFRNVFSPPLLNPIVVMEEAFRSCAN